MTKHARIAEHVDLDRFRSPIRILARCFQRSRDNWKQKYMELKSELVLCPDDRPLARQHYGLAVVWLFCCLVLVARTSLTGASAVLALFFPDWNERGEIPHPTTGRGWLLRVGLFKLQRPQASADDWFWLVDHTIQIGKARSTITLPSSICIQAGSTCSASAGRSTVVTTWSRKRWSARPAAATGKTSSNGRAANAGDFASVVELCRAHARS